MELADLKKPPASLSPSLSPGISEGLLLQPTLSGKKRATLTLLLFKAVRNWISEGYLCSLAPLQGAPILNQQRSQMTRAPMLV